MSKLRQCGQNVNKPKAPGDGWGATYERAGLGVCPVYPPGPTETGKRAKGVAWQEPHNQHTTAAAIDSILNQGDSIGCVHNTSGTATLDMDTHLHLVLYAMQAVGVDLVPVLMTSGPCSWGDRSKPPKKWFRVPQGVELTKHALAWGDVPDTVQHAKSGSLTVFELRSGVPGGAGFQDLLPPSMHKSGVSYEWVGDPPKKRTDIPEIPPALLRVWQLWDKLEPAMVDANPWHQGDRRYEVSPNAPDPWVVVERQLKRLQWHKVWGESAQFSLAEVQKIMAASQTKAGAVTKAPAPAQAKTQTKTKTTQPRPAEAQAAPDWTVDDWCRVWCEHVTPQQMLERHGGFKKASKKGKQEAARYLWKESTTGEAGVVVLEGEDGRLRVYSHHGADPLARGPSESYDAWGLLKLLEHGNDTHRAILSAHRELSSMGVSGLPAVHEKKQVASRTGAQAQQPTARPAQKRAAQVEQQTQALQTSDDEGTRDLSEDGVALSLADSWQTEHGSTVRYTPSTEQWRVWAGHRWVLDVEGFVERSAMDHMRELGRHAINQAHIECTGNEAITDKEKARRLKQAYAEERRLRSRRVRQEVLRTAAMQVRQVTSSEQWDSNPWQLATPDGVVDLRTGVLRPANPGDLVTQCTAVGVAPEGTRPELWLATLHYLMGGEQDAERAAELVSYLRRWCGYLLTGSVSEQVLVFGFGEGRNGKTLAVQTIARILGDYATTFPTSILMAQQNEQHPTEVARLMGKRLAVGSETESGRKFAEAKLKQLTGGDRLVARFMRQDFFEFEPTFKLFIVGNHKPDLQHVDVAMRRRLHLLPFSVTVPEHRVDPDLPAKLLAEGPAILRWMVDGCLEWQEAEGLRPPQAVLDAVADYFEEQDTVGAWLQDCCVLEAHAKTPSAHAWASWQRWCHQLGEDPGTQRGLTAKLNAKGLRRQKSTGGARMLVGVRLKE